MYTERLESFTMIFKNNSGPIRPHVIPRLVIITIFLVARLGPYYVMENMLVSFFIKSYVLRFLDYVIFD